MDFINYIVARIQREDKTAVDALDEDGFSALMIASQNGYTESVKYLIDAKASIDLQTKLRRRRTVWFQEGWSALILASEKGHKDIVKYLIEAKASVDLQREDGESALTLASQNGNTEIVKTLIEANASLDLQTQDQFSSLMCASHDGHIEIVKNFIEANASLDLQNKDGWSALMFASHGGHTQVVKYLIKANASLDLQKKDGGSALSLASQDGNTEIVKYLIKANASLDLQTQDELSALMCATLDGHTEIVKYLIEANASLDLQKKNGWSALMFASHDGRTDIVKLFIQGKASLDLQNRNGWSALMFASHDGHTEIIKYLIEGKASLDLQNKDGWSALMFASHDGHTEIVKYLIQGMALLDLQTLQDEWSALMYASHDGQTEIVKYLIEANALLDLQDKGGNSALILASRNGHIMVVKHLIDGKASLDLQTKEGYSALMKALQKDHTEIVKYLIDAKASLDLQTKGGKNALTLASQTGNTEIVKYLIEANASLDLQTQDGWSALMFSSHDGHTEIVKHLIKGNASLDLQTQDGWSALMIASQNGNTEVVKYLIEAGASLDLQTEEGETALIFASENGHTEMVKYLIEAKSSLDLQTKDGGSALILASHEGHTEIVKYLVEANASVDLQAQNGSSALILASLNGHTDVVTYFINVNASLDLQTQDGGSALILASQNGHTEIVKYLIMSNASLDLQTQDGMTALLMASDHGYLEIVESLTKAKASLDSQNKDGQSALMLAIRSGNTHIVQHLINQCVESKISVDLKDKKGETALHYVCRINPTNVRMIVLLIESMADLEVKNKNGCEPLQLLPARIKNDVERYRPIETAVNRRDYSKLLARGSNEMKTVKLFLLGHPAAGKTTLKKSLIKPHLSPTKPGTKLLASLRKNTTINSMIQTATDSINRNVMGATSGQRYLLTPGIDIGNYEVAGVGPLCIWDAAGQIEFHVTHSMFLGSENAMAVIAYDLRGGYKDIDMKLKYWLKFINSSLSMVQKSKFKIVLVGTHLDYLKDETTGQRLWTDIVTKIADEFYFELDIERTPIIVNGCASESDGMDDLRKQLKAMADRIRGNKMIPRLCEEILSCKDDWIQSMKPEAHVHMAASSTSLKSRLFRNMLHPSLTNADEDTYFCPVVRYSSFQEKVRCIDPLATSDFIKIAGNYLQDIGEIYIASFGNEEPLVVLNTQWLCCEIIGPTFAGNEFADQLAKLPEKPFFSTEELQRFYHKVADVHVLHQLLRSLDLMVEYAQDKFIIFAKLSETKSLPLKKMKYMYGVCIFCADRKTMFLPGLYPAIQARIMKQIKMDTEDRRPFITQRALKFVLQEEGVVELSANKEEIKVVVGTDSDNLMKCHQDLQRLTAIIETALIETSRGTIIERGYLSSLDLHKPDVTPEDLFSYSQEIIEAAELKDGFICDRDNMKEEITDIMVTGHDTTFIRKQGINCDIKWMLADHKDEYLAEMDSIDGKPLRQDYRSLAQVLGIHPSKVRLIEIRCRHQQESETEQIIKHWCETTKGRMNFQLLLTVLQHPGLVGNETAYRSVVKTLQGCGHQGPIANDETSFIALELDVILWRAALRRTYHVLQTRIKPSEVPDLDKILPPKDMEKIKVKEERDGCCIEATDMLFGKLMALDTPGWPEEFLDALKQHHPNLVKALRGVYDQLKDDVFAEIDFEVEDEPQMPSAIAGRSNYVKVCEAVQALCYLCLPTIQACVEAWHQDRQQRNATCQTPSKCPSYKKPKKNGACQACINWRKAVESAFYPLAAGKDCIQWKNVNATLLHKDPVEVAKGFVFILPDKRGCKDFEDFDVGGILKLMMGFADYHGGDQICYGKIQKVVDIRNGLSHMKIKDNLYISDKQLDKSLDYIESCVDAIQCHQQNLQADCIKDAVKQIRQSDVTTQMNTNALCSLTGDLKQSLEEAQEKRTQQLEEFMINQLQVQTQELKDAIEENRKKGVDEVVDRQQMQLNRLQLQLDLIMETLNKLSPAT